MEVRPHLRQGFNNLSKKALSNIRRAFAAFCCRGRRAKWWVDRAEVESTAGEIDFDEPLVPEN
jgi:hypothetical protein